MKKVSVKQYKDALQNAFPKTEDLPKDIVTLQALYYFPNSSAKAEALAKVLNPQNPNPIVASGAVGRVGKKISLYLGVNPDTYPDRGIMRPAYFSLVGFYYADTGWEMHENLQIALEQLGYVDPKKREVIVFELLPTEFEIEKEIESLKEGKLIEVLVNRFERNQKARDICIAHYGAICAACTFDFSTAYPGIANAKGFIHVHHKIPLSEIKAEYIVDPINDLIPLCANCHSIVHLRNPPMDVEELKEILKNRIR
jgi:5-methylcytosine-specific restriction protein A